MLTYSEPTRQFHLSEKLKPKTAILGSVLVLGVLFYSQSIKPPKTVELSTNNQSPEYTKWVERLADSYTQIAEESVKKPGDFCFKLTITDCLEQLRPDQPRKLKSFPPATAIRSDLTLLGYQVRMDAIDFAKERLKDTQQPSSL
jgi:hypothetical protein